MSKKNNNKNELINDTNNKETEYKFIKDIIMQNVGTITDEFIKINMGQLITKYNANTFAMWCAEGIDKSYNDISIKFNELKKLKKNNIKIYRK